jgi:hypothetical protein
MYFVGQGNLRIPQTPRIARTSSKFLTVTNPYFTLGKTRIWSNRPNPYFTHQNDVW